ncbi:MAG: hypothetical protein AAFV96_11645, partial [Pseudomonadota bacterium]
MPVGLPCFAALFRALAIALVLTRPFARLLALAGRGVLGAALALAALALAVVLLALGTVAALLVEAFAGWPLCLCRWALSAGWLLAIGALTMALSLGALAPSAATASAPTAALGAIPARRAVGAPAGLEREEVEGLDLVADGSRRGRARPPRRPPRRSRISRR